MHTNSVFVVLLSKVDKFVTRRGPRSKVKSGRADNFFILKIEKRNKVIVFHLFLSCDFLYFIQKVGAAAQKSGGTAALTSPSPSAVHARGFDQLTGRH